MQPSACSHEELDVRLRPFPDLCLVLTKYVVTWSLLNRDFRSAGVTRVSVGVQVGCPQIARLKVPSYRKMS